MSAQTCYAVMSSPSEEGRLAILLIQAKQRLAELEARTAEMEKDVNRFHDRVMRDPSPWMVEVLARSLLILRNSEYAVIQARASVELAKRNIRKHST